MIFPNLSLRRLAIVATVVPLVFVAAYSYVLLVPARDLLDSVWGFPAIIAAAGLAIAAFSALMFGAIGRLQRDVERLSRVASRQNTQLRALNEANLVLSQEMQPAAVLQRVADLSRELVQARYAALSVVDDHGDIKEFHTSGMDDASRASIGDPPAGKGLLGLILNRTEPLRLENLKDNPASTKLPPGHPPITNFLGVPIRFRGQPLGSLYLTNKVGDRPFSAEDEEIAQLFANQAGVAIQNTRMRERVQALAVETERSRISREMHDGVAQLLSFANTKAQAVEAFLASGDVAAAREHLGELSDAAGKAYQDMREGILALRTQVGEGRSLQEVLEEYVSEYVHQAKSRVKLDLEFGPEMTALTPIQEVQILRIVQESLTNVRKHAQATRIVLRFVRKDDHLEIEIRDNGRGFNPKALQRGEWPHFGLQTMRERSEAIGGTFELESVPGNGTTVRVRVPLNRPGPVEGRGT